MKRLVIYLMVLIASQAVSQNRVTLMLSQDIRLGLIGDDKGNTAYTTNIKLRSEWQGNQLEHGYFFGGPEIEYADLQKQYWRSSLNIGYTHNKFSRRFLISYSLGYGTIARRYSGDWFGWQQFSADGYIKLRLTKKLFAFSNVQIVDRNDLVNRKIIISVFAGLGINL